MKQLSACNITSKLESVMDTLVINQQSEEPNGTDPPSIQLKFCMSLYHIDEDAWNYDCKTYYKKKVIKALTAFENFEQQRLVLHHVLVDPKVINLASSIGTNLEEASVHRTIVGNMRHYLNHAKLSSRCRITNNN